MNGRLNHRLMHKVPIVIVMFVAFGCGSRLVKSPLVTEAKSPADAQTTERSGVVKKPTSRHPNREGFDTCQSSWSASEKLAFIDQAVEESNLEAHAADQGFFDDEQRARLSILSAGIMPDSLPLITMERDCWARFYEAHRELRLMRLTQSRWAAAEWRTCLQANFPDRIRHAEKYFACLGLTSEP